MHTPEIIYFKIEPMQATKVLTFYSIKHDNHDYLDDSLSMSNKTKSTNIAYNISITNTIGISLIDNSPKEIVQISLNNVVLTYSTTDEISSEDIQNRLEEEKEHSNTINHNNIAAIPANTNSNHGNTFFKEQELTKQRI